MEKVLIKNAKAVSEDLIFFTDLLINKKRIEKISQDITDNNAKIIDAKGCLLFPGIIDDQVHFREPGLTHKATIESESKAAIAGGITSFIEQPNTNPQTITFENLNNKFQIAKKSSYANYSFMFGGTNNNIELIKQLKPNDCAGIKLFLGSSTGNMLIDDESILQYIFSSTNHVISVHCEDETTIANNLNDHRKKYGNNIPFHLHPKIRSETACYISSSKAVSLAKKTNARLHIFHISTGKEIPLFDNKTPLRDKKITAEVCVHHLTFSDKDYQTLGSKIKWNPAIKTEADRLQLWLGLNNDYIDIIATDHAPHTLEEKNQSYLLTPSGGPLVQTALLTMLEHVKNDSISLKKLVIKMCHNPAILFEIKDRGYIREGYYADLVLIDPNTNWRYTKDKILYKCRWSPFENQTFTSKILYTFVNGKIAYDGIKNHYNRHAEKISFNR